MRVNLPPPSRYGSASTADLTPSVLARLGVPDTADVLDLPEARGYVVVVVDGLGWHQLQNHAEVAPGLSGAAGRVLDAVHPSTTAANLASIGTGRPAGEHGLVGYSTALPDDDRPFNLLKWSLGPHMAGESVLDRVVPEEYQPVPTVWERAAAAGIATTTVIRPEFVGSGLTRATLRGGAVREASDFTTGLQAAIDACQGDGPALAYVHHGAVDSAGHGYGPGSLEWKRELHDVDVALAWAAERLPADVVMLVTADHGMLRVDEDLLIDVTSEPTLMQGVRVIAGEARARQLHCRPGQAEAVAERWNDRLGIGFHVTTRERAIADGRFGPVVTDAVRHRIGDVLVWALAPDGGVVNPAVEPGGGRMPGMHGSITRAEVEVPLIELHA